MIIDTHLHLIDRSALSYPWLADVPALDHDYLYETYRLQAQRAGIIASLHMEVDVAPGDIERETGHVARLAAAPGSLIAGAIASCRPGGHLGYVGVAHGVSLPGDQLFFAEIHMLGGPAPVRRFLPDLIDRILKREINPGKVFTLRLPLEEAAEAYKAMDERRAIKVLLEP